MQDTLDSQICREGIRRIEQDAFTSSVTCFACFIILGSTQISKIIKIPERDPKTDSRILFKRITRTQVAADQPHLQQFPYNNNTFHTSRCICGKLLELTRLPTSGFSPRKDKKNGISANQLKLAASASAITIPTRLTYLESIRSRVDIAFIATDTDTVQAPSGHFGDVTTIHSIGQSTDIVLNIRSIPARVSQDAPPSLPLSLPSHPSPSTLDRVARMHIRPRIRICVQLNVCLCALQRGSDNSFGLAGSTRELLPRLLSPARS